VIEPVGDEVAVYYTVTLAVHVIPSERQISRVVEIREEVHPLDSDPPMLLTGDGIVVCEAAVADEARKLAEELPWPAVWEFGY
jgi:hypothetical protein